MHKTNHNRIVYSTESGRIPLKKEQHFSVEKGDGIVRILRQTKGRKGKGVCIISGLELDNAALADLLTELKKKCGCGGTIKQGNLEIQGDKRDELKVILETKGMRVKLAGG